MKYGPIAESMLDERILNTAKPVLDASVALMQTKCMMVATRLGLFERLHAVPADCESLAEAMQLDRGVLRLVLRTLASAGYLREEEGRYAITPLTAGCLLRRSRNSHVAHVTLMEGFWNAIGRLDSVLRAGTGPDIHHVEGGIPDWTAYQRAMLEQARLHAPIVAQFVPVRPDARRLLDIAGSHGMFGARICRAHPPMRSTVMELPAAMEAASELAALEGLLDVVSHRAGNALTDHLGFDNDVVLLCNILHHLSRQQCATLIARAHASMRSGGTIAIWEFRVPDPNAPPDLLQDATSLVFRAVSRDGCFSEEEYRQWLTSAGFVSVSAMKSMLTPHHVLMLGRVP
jgi:hypothetical protein